MKMYNSRLIKLVIFVIATVALATGCQRVRSTPALVQDTVHPRIFDAPAVSAIQRIVLIPFENGTKTSGISWQLQNHFAAALNARGHRSVVNSDGPFDDASCNVESVLRAEFPMQVLANAWRHYHADAVMFARVNQFSPYAPMSIGITVHVVDSRDARLLATIDRVFSLSDRAVLASYRNWLTLRFPGCTNIDIYQSSPTVFGEYVAFQTVRALR